MGAGEESITPTKHSKPTSSVQVSFSLDTHTHIFVNSYAFIYVDVVPRKHTHMSCVCVYSLGLIFVSSNCHICFEHISRRGNLDLLLHNWRPSLQYTMVFMGFSFLFWQADIVYSSQSYLGFVKLTNIIGCPRRERLSLKICNWGVYVITYVSSFSF